MRLFAVMFAALGLALEQAKPASATEVPFECHHGLLWLKVTVPQSPQPLNFLLDSGAGVSVIHLQTARRLGLQLGDRVKVRGVHSAATGYWPQRLEANLGTALWTGDFLAVDLCELSKACECTIDGLLGADFFAQHVVQLDFKANKMRILDAYQPSAGAELLPVKTQQRAFLIPVQVNGEKTAWMRLDTGCASPLEWVSGEIRGMATKDTMSVGLAPVNVSTATTSVQLGQTKFESVATGLHRKAIFRGEKGLLGLGLLSRFDVVTIDAKSGVLALEYRKQ